MIFLSLINRLIANSEMAKFYLYVFSVIVLIHACKAQNANTVQTNKDMDNYKWLYPYKPLTLVCNVTIGQSPLPTVTWKKGTVEVKESDRIKLLPGSALNITKALESDTGNYTCTVNYTLEDRTVVSIIEDFIVVVRPGVWLPKTVNIVEGDKLTLNCSVTGVPMPEVKWIVGNETYTETMGRIILEADRGIPNVMLVIEETVLEDRGDYRCIAMNVVNSTETKTFVRVKDKLAALWPFLGICAEVFVLCTIILIYEKRRNKAELEESDTDQSPEKNTQDMGKDKDVRHRK